MCSYPIASSPSVVHPRVLWAQDKKNVFLTIELVEAKDEQITIEPTKFAITAKQAADGSKQYSASIEELYGEIDPSLSSQSKTDRHFYFNLVKKDGDAPFWPRLQKSTQKIPFLHTDFSKWRDEDEQEEDAFAAGGAGAGGFDPSMFNFGGSPGGAGFDMGGEEDGEDDPYGFDSKANHDHKEGDDCCDASSEDEE